MELFLSLFSFDNIGKKIKTLTKLCCWISIIFVLLISLGFIVVVLLNSLSSFRTFIAAIIVAAATPVAAGIICIVIYLSNWFAYGFGEIVDSAIYLNPNANKSIFEPKESSKNVEVNEDGEFFCKKCWKKVGKFDTVCTHCGAQLDKRSNNPSQKSDNVSTPKTATPKPAEKEYIPPENKTKVSFDNSGDVFCKNCWKKVDKNDAYCPYCNEKL